MALIYFDVMHIVTASAIGELYDKDSFLENKKITNPIDPYPGYLTVNTYKLL